jgi:hypothetical protein
MGPTVRFGLMTVLVALAAATPVEAQKKNGACALLTAQEIEATFGVKPEAPLDHEEVAQKAPWKGETLRRCNWQLGKNSSAGNVYVNVGVTKTEAQRQASWAQLDQVVDQFKSRGWPVEKKALGKVTCVVGSPPVAQKVATVVHCFTEDKGRGVAVSPTLVTGKVSAESVKALLEKALSRLP